MSSSCVYYLVIGSSTEPSLFHAGCRPSHQVGLRPVLTSDLLIRKEHPALTSDLLIRKAHPTLTSDHVVNYNHIRKAQHLYLTYSSKWHHIHPGWNHLRHNDERTMFSSPRLEPHLPQLWKTFNQARTTSTTMMKEIYSFHAGWNHIRHNEERFLHLYLTYSSEGNNPIQAGTTSATMMKELCSLHPSWSHIHHNDGILSTRLEPLPPQ